MERIEGISDSVQYVFTLSNLVYVMPALRKIGIDTTKILSDCWLEYDESDRKESQPKFFLKYGVRVVNPLLNEILQRPVGYPSFNEILEHALKDVIANDPSLPRRLKKKGG